jgi:hypothetical protein
MPSRSITLSVLILVKQPKVQEVTVNQPQMFGIEMGGIGKSFILTLLKIDPNRPLEEK